MSGHSIIAHHGVEIGKLVQSTHAVALVNGVALDIDITVPAQQRWRFIGARIQNPDDANRSLTIAKYVATVLFRRLYNETLNATTWMQFPSSSNINDANEDSMRDGNFELKGLMIEGNIMQFAFGAVASTGATDADGLRIEYLRIDC